MDAPVLPAVQDFQLQIMSINHVSLGLSPTSLHPTVHVAPALHTMSPPIPFLTIFLDVFLLQHTRSTKYLGFFSNLVTRQYQVNLSGLDAWLA